MKTLRNSLLARLHILLKQTGAEEHKEELYAGYGVSSSREMTDRQLADIVSRLEDEIHIRTESRIKTRRSVILRLLTDIGVYYVLPGEPKSACWDRVNDFLSSPKIAGQELYKLNEAELVALERRLRGMKEKGYYYRRRESVPTGPLVPGLPELPTMICIPMAPADPNVIN